MPDIIIDSLIKYKNEDNSFTTIHPISKTANIKTTEAIDVMLTNNVGSFKNGDKIEANTSVDSILRKLLQVQIPPSYSNPSISFKVSSGDAAGSYEEGTEVSPTFTATFTQNDAGALTNIVTAKNGTGVDTATSSPATYTETFTVSGTTKFKATASYAQGVLKQDNFGEDYSTGRVDAGSITSSELSFTSFRKYFYGTDAETTAATTSDAIRALTNSTKGAAAGTTFNVSVTKGQRRATFAYPATLRDVSSVKYVEFNNDESKMFFTKSTVKVEGANGHEAIDYKVYTYIPDQPFPSNMTFAVTI